MARRPVGLEKGQQKKAGGRGQITWAPDTAVRALGFVFRIVGGTPLDGEEQDKTQSDVYLKGSL